MPKIAGSLLLTISMMLVGTPPASAYPRPGWLERIGPEKDVLGKDVALSGTVSHDGRWVLLTSTQPLLPEDTNQDNDLYLLDRQAGSMERVCHGTGGEEPNGHCFYGGMSDDGRVVVFTSDATNLIQNDVNGSTSDVYVWDRDTKGITLVSVTSSSMQTADAATYPDISADGNVVAFTTFADLTPEDAAPADWQDVYVRDLAAGTTELVTIATDGSFGTTNAMFPAVSGDGRYVAYSTSHPFDPRDTNPFMDVYVRDRVAGTTEIASLSTSDTAGNASATYASISDDGRFVAFGSGAGNLIPEDNMGGFDTFIRDRQTGRLERVVSSTGTEPNDVTSSPVISPDGRYVQVHTLATNLGYQDQNGRPTDVYLYDRLDRTIELVSINTDGITGNAYSFSTDVFELPGGDRASVLYSNSTDLLEGGSLPGSMYIRHMGPELGVGRMSASAEGDEVRLSGTARFSSATLADVEDPAGDAGRAASLDLTSAMLRYRPEEGDVLVELGVSALRPHAGPVLVGAAAPREPGVATYAVSFDGCVQGPGDSVAVCGRHEVRASQDLDTDGATVGLYRCASSCSKVASVTGGIGTAGEVVRVSVPVGLLGGEGATLGLRKAYAAFGETTTGLMHEVDQVGLTTGKIPAATLAVAVAPAGSPAGDADFSAVPVENGRFQGVLERGSGPRKVWVRVCVGSVCSFDSVSV